MDRLATGLLDLGLAQGDRVGIWSPNRPEWLLTQFATARIGAILVNVNPAYRVGELEYALSRVGCAALILADRFEVLRLPRDDRAARARARGGRAGAGCGPLRCRRCGRSSAWAARARPACSTSSAGGERGRERPRRLDAVTAALAPADPINIQFTSGTTGSPKGATLTHHNIVNNARFVTAAMNLAEGRPARASRCRSIIASAW